jgi:DNA segregation ATPase FtsK/SpoIIIE-like protein
VHLPKVITEVPAPDFDTLSIPLLYDGSTWAWLPLTAGNHSGVFGMTRSGKGNAVQHILLQALTFGPELVRAIVLDAKGGLDYAFCDDLEHADLYSDKTISDGLQVALTEMESRKTILRAGRYRNHYEYQKKTGKTLPLIVVIADELTQFTDEQNEQLVTLACVSGAMGFILLLATQHPLAKYLPTPVQANVGFRLVFRLASSEHIRIALKRTRDDEGTYNPALIGANQKGVGVLRGPGGDETLGRVPEVTDGMRDALIAELVNRWPKTTSVSKETFPAKIIDFERGKNGNEAETALKTGEETPTEPVTERPNEEKVIELLLQGKMSKRQILDYMGGNRKNRLDQINQVELKMKVKGEQSNG